VTKNINTITKTEFNATYRYIDDLIALNNSQFERIKYDIYPISYLNLKNTDEVPGSKVHYLDLSIQINQSKFLTTTYDKRDDFGFEIISYPFLEGNYPELPTPWCLYISAHQIL